MTTPNPTPAHVEMARAAAEWWSTAMRAPTHDNGDPASMAILKPMLELAKESRPEPDESILDAFKRHLAEDAAAQLAQGRTVFFDVDYNPSFNLTSAANKAGLQVPQMGWPWKTCMRLDPDAGTVKVKAGYGAPWATVYPS